MDAARMTTEAIERQLDVFISFVMNLACVSGATASSSSQDPDAVFEADW
jgi:hypothetical protein